VKFGMGERSAPLPNFTFIEATCRSCGAKKLIFGPLSKNNTRMVALRAGLPVTRNQYASPPEGNAIPAGPLLERF